MGPRPPRAARPSASATETDSSPTFGALVEISTEVDNELLQRLLYATYRFCAEKRSLIVLKDLSADDVDRILDDVVASVGVEVAGIEYLSEAGVQELAHLVRRSELAVVASSRLRRRLVEALPEKTPVHDVTSGLELLEEGGRSAAHPSTPSTRAASAH